MKQSRWQHKKEHAHSLMLESHALIDELVKHLEMSNTILKAATQDANHFQVISTVSRSSGDSAKRLDEIIKAQSDRIVNMEKLFIEKFEQQSIERCELCKESANLQCLITKMSEEQQRDRVLLRRNQAEYDKIITALSSWTARAAENETIGGHTYQPYTTSNVSADKQITGAMYEATGDIASSSAAANEKENDVDALTLLRRCKRNRSRNTKKQRLAKKNDESTTNKQITESLAMAAGPWEEFSIASENEAKSVAAAPASGAFHVTDDVLRKAIECAVDYPESMGNLWSSSIVDIRNVVEAQLDVKKGTCAKPPYKERFKRYLQSASHTYPGRRQTRTS